MKSFADLLETLVLTPSRNRKIEAMVAYLQKVPDPARGYAIAAITRDLKLKTIQASLLRELISTRIDSELFKLSYDYVGDLAETIALLWESDEPCDSQDLDLLSIIQTLSKTSRSDAPGVLSNLLDQLDHSGRYALIKLATGGLRIGVSSRLAKQALAEFGAVDLNEIEELWHGLEPPYEDLFAWLEGREEKPISKALAPFRPVMLSNALEEREHEKINSQDFVAEWKWDGIRVQMTCDQGVKRLYSRTGDDISRAFPDLIDAMNVEGTFDGELLVRTALNEPLEIRTFSDLQQRLNRKTVSKAMLETHPAFIRLYDILIDQGEDCREEPLEIRRERLESAVQKMNPERVDISEQLAFSAIDDLAKLRAAPPHSVIEGVMVKARYSPYKSGRPRGLWYKWKRDPMVVDAVLMYAQRGHGKRSGYYSDFTFGCWRKGEKGDEIVPVGKAYFGFTDEELKQLDKFVRENTVERFGPVRSVKASSEFGLVLEVAFEGINRSSRHKSGVAMRFPRISRIRWDKPSNEADRLETLEAMIGDR